MVPRNTGFPRTWFTRLTPADARETAVDALIKLANGALHGEPAVRREVVAGSAEIGRCPLGPGREMELHRGMVFAGGPGEIVARILNLHR